MRESYLELERQLAELHERQAALDQAVADALVSVAAVSEVFGGLLAHLLSVLLQRGVIHPDDLIPALLADMNALADGEQTAYQRSLYRIALERLGCEVPPDGLKRPDWFRGTVDGGIAPPDGDDAA